MPADTRGTAEERMDDIRAVLDAAGSSSAFLLGTADGTPVAMLAAASYPDRFAGLVLYGSSARIVEGDDYAIGFAAASADKFVMSTGRIWANDDTDCGLALLAPSV